MNLLQNFFNKTPQLQELKLMHPYPIMAENQPQNLGRNNVLAGVKNSVSNLYDKIIGANRTIENPISVNSDGSIDTGLAKIERQGFIPDLMSGYQENSTQKFAPENLELDHDNKKSIAFRLGEGLGTAKRVLDSPLGRGLIAGGLILGTGGGALPALTFGGSAAITNQKNRVFDNVYRNALEQMDFDTSSIGGYVDENIYKNILAAKQLQDNYEWRKDQMEMTRQQNEIMNDIRRQGIAVDRAKVEASKNKIDKKELARARQASSTVNMINKALETVKNNPDAFGFSKGVLPSDAVDRLDPKGTKSRAIINSVTAEYRKYLTGAQMGEKERQYYEKFLPNPRDNAQTTEQKLKGMLMVISAREGIDTEEVGTITTNNAQPKTNDLPAAPKKIGKYTVEVQ